MNQNLDELALALARRRSRELVLGCDATGAIIYADERAARLIGARVGQSLAQLAAPGCEDKAKALCERAAAAPVNDWELAFVTDGRACTVCFGSEPLESHGGALLHGTVIGDQFVKALEQVNVSMAEVVTLNRQVTAGKRELERRNDELTRINRELSDSHQGVRALHDEIVDKSGELVRQAEIKARVVANVSHEFRTPLHAILGLTQILSDGVDGPLTEEQQKQVKFIRTSAEELLAMVNDILDLTKVEAGRAALKAEEFPLSDFLASMRGALRPLCPPGAEVELVFDDLAEDVQLDTDRGKLSQIVRNLVSNALKFTKRGEVRVSLRREGKEQIAIAVKDTGIGIAPADQERIFEEFTQLETPQHAEHKGTGLGLPLSRSLAELLGGRITVESAPGRGSTFTVIVPVDHPEVTEMHQVEARSRAAMSDGNSILVVEDDRKTIFIYEKYLTLAGFHVIAVRSNDEARGVLAKVRPAAIVLDIVLENETSWDFLAEVKRDPRTSDIPVLVCTVTNREQKARALGADEFWLKPINQDRLLRRLRQLSSATTPRVLVIDDDEKARYLIRRHLHNQPYELQEATSGPEGIEKARAQPPHVIFLDFLLQDMTAFDVLDELKADPRTRTIPVIVVTSQVLDTIDRNRLLQEAEAVISKESLSRELAINRIRDALRKAGRSSSSA